MVQLLLSIKFNTTKISTVFDRSKFDAPKKTDRHNNAQIIVRSQPAADDTFQVCVCA